MSDRDEDYFTPETKERLNEVRKELYFGGLTGVLLGSAFGGLGFMTLIKYNPKLVKVKDRKNILVASILVWGAIGSFVSALSKGKNSVQYIGDIFKVGSNSTSNYRNILNNNEMEILNSTEESFRRREEAIRKKKSDKF